MKTKQYLSITDSLISSAKEQGVLVSLNSPAEIRVIEKMNRQLEDARREYRVKERASIDSASKTILTT